MASESGRDVKRLRRAVENVIEQVNQEADVVVVEGSKDERGLRKAGLTVPVMKYSRISIWLFVHRLTKNYEQVVILTDFDEKGEEYNAELQERLEGRVNVLKRLRKEFGKVITQSGRRDIEALNNLFTG